MATTTITKLSEAIRKGAQYRPQAFGKYYIERWDDDVICSCALGAAAEGLTGKVERPDVLEVRDLLNAYFIALEDSYYAVPRYEIYALALDKDAENRLRYHWRFEKPEERVTIFSVIVGLNDYYKWTREQIADWLEKRGL